MAKYYVQTIDGVRTLVETPPETSDLDIAPILSLDQVYLHGPPVAWASGVTFAANDTVTYGGSAYVSLVDGNFANTPDSSPTQWRLFAVASNASARLASARATANQSVTSATFVDVTNTTVAPNTTSPIELIVSGSVKLAQDTGTPTALVTASFQIIDDLSVVIAARSISFVPGTSGVVVPLHFECDVTPASAARAYRVQAKTSATTATVTLHGGSAVVGSQGGFGMKARLQ